MVDTGGRYLSGWLELPLYLDMVGTALAAMALGPWWGVLVALASQGLAAWWTDGLAALWIAPVNVVGALVWGYGLRSWRSGRSLPSFLGLTAVAAVTCSLVAVPVLLLVPGMQQRQAPGETADDIQAVWHSVVVAVLSSNMLYSLADKLLAGVLVLPALQSLRRHWWIPVFTTTFDESVTAVRDAAFVARLRAGRWFSRRTVR